MITLLILNSMTRDHVQNFMFVQSNQELWKEIEEYYGVANGPLLLQLEHEVSNLCQVNQ